MLQCKKSKKGIVDVALHEDDNLMIRDIEAIDEFLTTLKENKLMLKIMKELLVMQSNIFNG